MKALSLSLLYLLQVLISPVMAEGLPSSLRGASALDTPSAPPIVKRWQDDQAPIMRSYVQQPPLIPHTVEDYQVNLKSNKCLTCHSWANYRQSGATKISQTHFADRNENALDNVAARRYFCSQCHVPQTNAQPLVENTFNPVPSLR